MSFERDSVRFPHCFRGGDNQRAWPDGVQPPALFAWMTSELFSLSLCEPVGLGCYWVDYSELWKWKRTSLTFTNSGNSSSLFYPSFSNFHSLFIHIKATPALFPCPSQICTFYTEWCATLVSNALRLLACVHRTAVPQWRPPIKATPHELQKGLLASRDPLTLLGGPVEVSLHTSALTSLRHVLKMGRETLPTLMQVHGWYIVSITRQLHVGGEHR